MMQQPVGKLRDREHEHQVEEQLDEGDPMVLVAVADAEVIVAGGEHARASIGNQCAAVPPLFQPRPPSA